MGNDSNRKNEIAEIIERYQGEDMITKQKTVEETFEDGIFFDNEKMEMLVNGIAEKGDRIAHKKGYFR